MRQFNEENLNDTGVVLSTANPSETGKMFSYNGINVRMRKMNGYILVCLTDFARLFPDKNLSTIINSKEMYHSKEHGHIKKQLLGLLKNYPLILLFG